MTGQTGLKQLRVRRCVKGGLYSQVMACLSVILQTSDMSSAPSNAEALGLVIHTPRLSCLQSDLVACAAGLPAWRPPSSRV